MAVRLRPLDGQVIVGTGASSGTGPTTARCAARRGARRGAGLVPAARNEGALRELPGAGGPGVLAGRAARR